MKKKFLGIVCFLYSVVIMYAWISNTLKSYLAPNMQIYLKISIIPMLIIGCVLVFNNKVNYKFKISDLVLLLPIFMIVICGDGNLSVSFAKSKITSISNRVEKKEKLEEKEDDNKQVEVDFEIVDKNSKEKEEKIEDIYFDIEDSTYSYLADYITYIAGARKFDGKTIRVRGFALDYSDYLQDGYFALGKYAITCCAADAEFSGFMIKYDLSKIKYGSWYEVVGVLKVGQDKEGYTVMTIDATSVKEISSKGEEQYVYSCASYGDGKCSDLLKYDLDY